MSGHVLREWSVEEQLRDLPMRSVVQTEGGDLYMRCPVGNMVASTADALRRRKVVEAGHDAAGNLNQLVWIAVTVRLTGTGTARDDGIIHASTSSAALGRGAPLTVVSRG